MTVLKRNKKDSNEDLIQALDKFIKLLKNQKEDDAVSFLSQVVEDLRANEPGSEKHKNAIKKIFEAFDGDLELSAYTYQRADSDNWTEADELFQASTRVLNLAKRFS